MEVDKRMNQDYSKSMLIKTFQLGALISVLLMFVHIKYGMGFFLGVCVSGVNLALTTAHVDRILRSKETKISLSIAHFMIKYALIILAFLIGVTIPEWVNLYTVALGLFMFKIMIYSKEIFFRKKGGN
jgi:hypothetical protein